MDKNNSTPLDKRAAVRITCKTPLIFKVMKDETMSKIMEGYIQNVSKDGLKCTISKEIPEGCILWLRLDTDALSLCEELEKGATILQHGVLGKVIWVNRVKENNFEIGLQFITRELRDS